jgi:hypothetical protein
MLRTCNGTDSTLVAIDGAPCACGLTFDDVEHYVTFPHERIPTRAEREAFMAAYLDAHPLP